jgi:catechol 2,3-dioxygenase-like lactoylglutathione lyase family enzyme
MPSEGRPRPRHLSAIAGFRLVTADLPRLLAFYQGVLGFAAEGAEQAIGAAEMDLLGLRGAGRRQALRLGDQCLAIDRFDYPGRPYPEDGGASSLWFQHFALVVADMGQAYARVRGAPAITDGGPQLLPASSGGVWAYKFRDPDGHPLELLQFPEHARPEAWQGRLASGGQIGLGIDHSAISVADADASAAFYESLGLANGPPRFNQGREQQSLDDLRDVQVTVVPMKPAAGTPHLELLGYAVPRGAAGSVLRPNDVAATRIVWLGLGPVLLRDPDGHLQQIQA